MTSVETLYNCSKSVNDIVVARIVNQFTKDILDATKRGVFQTKLEVCITDINPSEDGPRLYVLASMKAIKKKYREIREEAHYENGYITHFTVSWNKGPLYDLSKIALYIEGYTKDIIAAANKGMYSTNLVVPESEFDYEYLVNPRPHIFTAIRAIEEAYAGIEVKECKQGGWITHFTVSWDEGITSKYRESVRGSDKINIS
jgi:hypothetical protein